MKAAKNTLIREFNQIVHEWENGPGRQVLKIFDDKPFFPSIPFMIENNQKQNVDAAAIGFDCLVLFSQYGKKSDSDILSLIDRLRQCIWNYVAELNPQERCFIFHLDVDYDKFLDIGKQEISTPDTFFDWSFE
jgi:hypothetical protein